MERFRTFLGRTVSLENVQQADALTRFGVAGRYVPDPPEAFDEYEFSADLKGYEQAGITFAVEDGTIQRIIFGEFDSEDPDLLRAFAAQTLTDFLKKHGKKLQEFFEFIAPSS